jgi:hypothetical protein
MSAQEIIRIATSFGYVVLRQYDLEEAPKPFLFEITKREVLISVPPGMTIERAVRLDLRLKSSEPLSGGSSNGEWLESTAFEQMNGSLSLGVRDHDWMASVGHSRGLFPHRLTKRSSGTDPECAYQVSYLPNGLLLDLGKIEARGEIQIPLGLALSKQSRDSLSTWFGVDAVLP